MYPWRRTVLLQTLSLLSTTCFVAFAFASSRPIHADNIVVAHPHRQRSNGRNHNHHPPFVSTEFTSSYSSIAANQPYNRSFKPSNRLKNWPLAAFHQGNNHHSSNRRNSKPRHSNLQQRQFKNNSNHINHKNNNSSNSKNSRMCQPPSALSATNNNSDKRRYPPRGGGGGGGWIEEGVEVTGAVSRIVGRTALRSAQSTAPRLRAAARAVVEYDTATNTLAELESSQRELTEKVFELEFENDALRRELALWNAVESVSSMYRLEELKEMARYEGVRGYSADGKNALMRRLIREGVLELDLTPFYRDFDNEGGDNDYVENDR
mmetsp:Transcript_20727/g.43578  ORF Transcript_20727/g.43578 Transcript_20727/m.43578 type:complete len:321 (-) Transcript_20727:246-1208(-)